MDGDLRAAFDLALATEALVLTLLRPGLLGEHVVGEDRLVGLWVLVLLEGDEGLGLGTKTDHDETPLSLCTPPHSPLTGKLWGGIPESRW